MPLGELNDAVVRLPTSQDAGQGEIPDVGVGCRAFQVAVSDLVNIEANSMGKSTRFAIEHYPMGKTPTSTIDNRGQRFIEAARELGCDESEANLEAALKKVARHKLVAGPKLASKGKPAK